MKLAPLFKFSAKERTGAGWGGDWLAGFTYSREAVNCFYLSLLLSLSYRVHREIGNSKESACLIQCINSSKLCVF